MVVRTTLKAEEKLVDAGKPPDGGRWELAEELPVPRVIFQSDRIRVTLRYDPEDWRGYFHIEEQRTDAMNVPAWVAYDPEVFPTHALLAHIFEVLNTWPRGTFVKA